MSWLAPHRSLLARLLLVVAVALLPALALQAYTEGQARRLRHAIARADALRILSLVVATQQEITQGARQMLTAVGATRRARDAGPAPLACDAYLADLLRSFDRYASLIITDVDGEVMCSGNLPAASGRTLGDVTDRAYWRRTMAAGDFVTGDFVRGRHDGRPELHFSQPVRDEQGRISGVVAVGLDLGWLQGRIDQIHLPAGTSITIADRHGTIIAHAPFASGSIGEHTDAVSSQFLDGDADGVVEFDQRGGGGRILAYSPLAVAPQDVWIGVASDANGALAGLAQADQQGVLLLIGGGVLGLLLTVLGTRFAIARPTARLLGAAAAWQRGEMSARTGLAADGSEFGRLGSAFDLMAGALQAREAALDQALESTTDSVFTLDHQFRFTWLNRRARAQLEPSGGREPGAREQGAREPGARGLVGQVIWDLFPELAGSCYEASCREALATGQPRMIEQDFAPLGVIFSTQIYPSDRGLTLFYRDVTQERRAARALAETQARLAGIAETIPGLVFVTDPAGRIIFVNRRTLDFTGLDAQSFIAGGLAAVAHEDERAALTSGWPACLGAQMEVRLRRADGVFVWHLIRGLPWVDDGPLDGDQTREWYGVATDIDAIVQARAALARTGAALEQEVDRRTAALAESEARLRAIFDNVPDLVLLLSLSDTADADAPSVRLDAANPAAARFLGRSTVGLAGCPIEALPALAPMLRLIVECARTGGEQRAELELPGEPGPRIVETLLVPLGPAGGRRVLAAIRDITERRALQARLAQAQKMEAVGQLTGGVAHDFNNLLQSMVSALELLRRQLGGTHAAADRLLETALRAAARGGQLTRQLLAFSRKQTLQPELVDIARLVGDIGELLRRAAGETVALTLDTGGAGAALICRVDPGQLESALLNLTLNARDAMPGGGALVLRVGAARLEAAAAARLELARGEYVRIDLADTGSGIAPEHLAHLFEPFFTTKEVGRGTGLGLAMVHGFLRQSGGAVTVDSTPGQGSEFSLYLPREAGPAMAEPPPAPARAAAPVGRQGGSILLVEDDPAVLTTTRELLEGAGHAVLAARDGPTALALAGQAGRIDLLLSDVVLPGGISGPQLVRRLQQLRPGLAVLLTSGYPRDMLERHGLDGAVRLLLKPVDGAHLLATVAAMLEPVQAG